MTTEEVKWSNELCLLNEQSSLLIFLTKDFVNSLGGVNLTWRKN
jgi:hypothetical protein